MYARQGVNRDYIKARNRGLVLQLICCSAEPVSRAVIAEQTGLSKMTVTNIVGELIEHGYVAEGVELSTAHAGRNPILLDIAPRSPRVIGLYLSRGAVTAVLTDLRLRPESRFTLPLEAETSETLAQKMRQAVDRALSQLNGRPLAAIGVSSIGPMDKKTGVLLHPTNFFGISDFPIVKHLRAHYGVPILTDNDMNAATLAERLYGKGRSLRNFVYVGITNGIGAGMITNGALYPDEHGFAGEIGHLCVETGGKPCSCGSNGCLELYANMPVILARLSEVLGRTAVPAELPALYAQPACRAVFDDLLRHLLAALTGLANLLNPESIVLGHEAAYLPDAFLNSLQQQLNRRILAHGYTHIAVQRASFGSDSALLGSACLACSALFSGSLPV